VKNFTFKHKAWNNKIRPKKILAMRFQALGDVMITLPYLQSLKERMPSVSIHLLTRTETREIPENLSLFEKVIPIGGGRNAKIQFILCVLLLPHLLFQRYDLVIDLQNHRISKIIRKLLMPRAWSEFDRSSKILAGDRTRLTIDALLIGNTYISTNLRLKKEVSVRSKLMANGWDESKTLVILNPAGAFTSRNWAIENYVAFAKLWQSNHPSTQFLALGLSSLKPRVQFLKAELRDSFIDLCGMTSTIEAFAMIRLSTLMLTEDSGLMHMSWIQGVPTVALFGSSPSYWSSPLGPWSRVLSSADLPCGDCFLNECKYGDVHCLTRFSPEIIFEEARALLNSVAPNSTR
jgi:ADP-heptose:LPS heptosyltransferase